MVFIRGFASLTARGLPFISFSAALLFGAIVLNATLMDTLDACTRLGRFVLSETFGDRIPALQNRTPREAIKTEVGREQVIELIDDWENSQLRMPNPQFSFDFNKLRRSLGLEVE